jgi:hypothetical protein
MRRLTAILTASLLVIVLTGDACAETGSPRFKSPAAGMFISLVPGALVHGAGSIYAGKPVGGGLLFLSEIGGAVIIAVAANDECESGEGWDCIGHNIGYIFLGELIFLASWVTDIVLTQIWIKKHNQRERLKVEDFSLTVSPSRFDGRIITLQLSFNF